MSQKKSRTQLNGGKPLNSTGETSQLNRESLGYPDIQPSLFLKPASFTPWLDIDFNGDRFGKFLCRKMVQVLEVYKAGIMTMFFLSVYIHKIYCIYILCIYTRYIYVYTYKFDLELHDLGAPFFADTFTAPRWLAANPRTVHWLVSTEFIDCPWKRLVFLFGLNSEWIRPDSHLAVVLQRSISAQ